MLYFTLPNYIDEKRMMGNEIEINLLKFERMTNSKAKHRIPALGRELVQSQIDAPSLTRNFFPSRHFDYSLKVN